MLQFTLTHVEADILNLTKSLMKANETKLFHAVLDLLDPETSNLRNNRNLMT